MIPAGEGRRGSPRGVASVQDGGLTPDPAGLLGGHGELRWSDGDVRIGDSRPARAEGARLHGVAAPGGCAGPPRGPCGRAARTADGQLWVEDGELSASGHAPDSGSDGGGVEGIPHAPFNGHHGRRSVNVVRFTGVPVDALLEALAQPAVVFADMPASAASSSGNCPSGGMPGRGPAPGRASRQARQHDDDAAFGTGGGSGSAGSGPPSPPPAAQGP